MFSSPGVGDSPNGEALLPRGFCMLCQLQSNGNHGPGDIGRDVRLGHGQAGTLRRSGFWYSKVTLFALDGLVGMALQWNK